MSKHLLLQVATPEAVVRLQNSALVADKEEVESIYFYQQNHHSIVAFLSHYVNESEWDSGALMQVSIRLVLLFSILEHL